METKHTPLPWCYGAALNYHGFYIAPNGTLPTLASVERCGAQVNVLVHNFPGETEANAAFIVRACNSHYELVAALTRLLRAFESDKNVMPNCDVLTCWETNSMAIKQALDALAKAKGE